MKVISYYECEDQQHWLDEIEKCNWPAGMFLHRLLSRNMFFEILKEGSKVLLLTDGDELISFCTYAKVDDIQPTDLSPWMGFVFTFPAYRGHHYLGLLFEEVERIARSEGVKEVYISTDCNGLYEKYGCEFLCMMNDVEGKASRVYVKRIY